jgi:hypothetical protein
MKKITLLFLLVLSSTGVFACDICGCAASSFSLGVLPGNNQHFIGMRSSLRSFTTKHPILFGIVEPPSQEWLTSSDLMGRYTVNERFQFVGILPWVTNWQKTENRTIQVNGIGDPTVLGNYIFVNTTDSLTRKYKQLGSIGLGVKMPLGKFEVASSDENRNLMPGSGSWDGLINAAYSVQRGNWGFMNETSYSLRGENKQAFKFGNAFSTTNLFFYRWIVSENVRVIPQLGFQFNKNARDQFSGIVTDDSFNGGTLFNSQIGTIVLLKNWAISAVYFLPVYQHIGNGYVEQHHAARLSLHYFFNSKKNKNS